MVEQQSTLDLLEGRMTPVMEVVERYEKRYETTPEHLQVLADGSDWALWRNIVVRGAGFPIADVLELASPACIQAADQLLQAESRWRLLSGIAQRRLELQQRKAADKDAARVLARAIKSIKNMQIPPDLDVAEKEVLSQATRNLQDLRATFTEAYTTAIKQTSSVIHKTARSERFREAIVWQNRAALHASITALLRHGPEAHGSEQRRREALIANYLQRYCTKNESIGFFGPLGWATLLPEGEALTITPGKSLLEQRAVYFEGWAIDALVEEMAKDNALLPYCVPRLLPHVYVDSFAKALVTPFANPIKLTRKLAAVLEQCDGLQTARTIASRLLLNPGSGIASEVEVYSILTQLRTARRIAWTLEAPAEGDPRSHPETRLRQVLARIDNPALRAEKMNIVAQLDTARVSVEQAAGNTAALDAAFDNLEKSFIELTGREATRSAGHMYAGRTLVYEDCRRDAKISLGPEIVRKLEQPLSLLLQSARWFTYEVAQSYREAFLDAFEELAFEEDEEKINFAKFWLWVQPLVFDETAKRPIDDVISAFQERWMDVLILQPVQRHIHYTSEELLPYIEEAFAASGPGWQDACYHSPDILLRAESQEAIRRGDYQFVLGELHIAMNTQQHLAFLEQHPRPEELISFATQDIPEPRVVPVFSKKNYPMTRMRPALIAPKDIRLLYSADVNTDSRVRTLPISALEVERHGGELVVRSTDGRWQFEIIDVFAEFLSRMVYKEFSLFSHHRYTPRVTIDQMVLLRESWSFEAGEIPFADEKDPAQRFLAARAWTRTHDIPRFAFVKVPSEFKPCFIDFASPIYVDAFARLVRNNKDNGRRIKVSEMLPEPDQAWLIDAEGQRYSSELRFVAVDMLRAAPGR